jgi:hypothetical protein
LQCNTIRSDNEVRFIAPRVQCVALRCSRVETEETTSAVIHTNRLEVKHTVKTPALCAHAVQARSLRLGTMAVETWFAASVGPHGAHADIQAFLDMAEENREEARTKNDGTADGGAAGTPPGVTVTPNESIYLEPNQVHNCTCFINQPRCTIYGQHSVLTGTIEITHECQEFRLVDCDMRELTILTSSEYQKQSTREIHYTLHNVRGTAKDWTLRLPDAQLHMRFCDIHFTNPITGALRAFDIAHSTLQGFPWQTVHELQTCSVQHSTVPTTAPAQSPSQ